MTGMLIVQVTKVYSGCCVLAICGNFTERRRGRRISDCHCGSQFLCVSLPDPGSLSPFIIYVNFPYILSRDLVVLSVTFSTTINSHHLLPSDAMFSRIMDPWFLYRDWHLLSPVIINICQSLFKCFDNHVSEGIKHGFL